jgi:hypothetical protein
MANRRFEMYEYRQVLQRMRQGDTGPGGRVTGVGAGQRLVPLLAQRPALLAADAVDGAAQVHGDVELVEGDLALGVGQRRQRRSDVGTQMSIATVWMRPSSSSVNLS